MLRDFPLLLTCIYTRQVLQGMKVECRDFSKGYEKPEAALAQFPTSILQGIQLWTGQEEGGTKSPEMEKLQCLCQVLGFRLWTFYHSVGKVQLTRGNEI